MTIKNRLRYWRVHLGIEDIHNFAELIDMNPWFVQQWEEQRFQPSLEAFCRIRERLRKLLPQITLDDLLDYSPQD
ncbi:MAG: hypothetical protein ACUVTU_09360 [Desulfurispora sp.]|uniref:hypothetical protein n=1 Tax=Desulfurispora TaxID=510701 RepID=UPI00036E3334|nr:hypothetical protein [Desulfurispora thermophila]